MKLSIERRAVLDLVPYEANSKNHGEADISAIAASITRFGFNDPIGITPEGIIVEGHGRWMAAQRLGLTEVPVLVIDGLEERDYDLYRIAHNKIAQTSRFDFAALFDQLQAIVGGDNGIVFGDMGFDDKLVNGLFSHFGDNEAEAGGIVPTTTAANSAAIAYEIVWDTKEDKAAFNLFMQSETASGADKSMGGELLLEAVRRVDPDLFQQIAIEVPDTRSLDEVAGQTMETQHV